MSRLGSVQHVAWENIVVPQPRARSDAGHIIDTDAVHDRSFACYSSRNASRVRPVILNGLRVDTLLSGLY